MPHSEAQAWWADVQHVRESIERRRAGGAESSAPLDAPDSPAPLDVPEERRFTRDAADSLPLMDDLDWTSSLPARSRSRFEHTDAGDGRSRRRSSPDRYDADEPLDFDAERAALEAPPARRSRRAADADTAAATATAPLAPPPARRTVQITGRTVSAPSLPRLVEVERRRPARRPAERVGPRPDRVALWAVLLGFFLILVAATSSHAATHPAHTNAAAVALHAAPR
jgi:hypothetical protein